jgi:hypothetical protein
MYSPCNSTTTTTSDYYRWNTNYSGWDTEVVVEYVEPPLIPPMKIPEGALKSWRIWMGWARALPRYRAVDASRLRRTRSLITRFSISKVVPAGRERGHAFGHSPRRRSIGG